jgi:hypothetical protein
MFLTLDIKGISDIRFWYKYVCLFLNVECDLKFEKSFVYPI